MIASRELIAVLDYDVKIPEDPFSFRLEIHQCGEVFTGSVYRLERFRLQPTFQPSCEDARTPVLNDALIYIRDEFIDESKLRAESKERIKAIFNYELQNIFNQQIQP